MERIAIGVSSRKRGEAIRLVYDKNMPSDLKKKMMHRLHIKELDTQLAAGRYQNHKDLMDFPSFSHNQLSYPKWPGILKP
ncbi:hypothetical protein QP572_12965, partial [Brevibacterium sp. UMB10442]|nr:hypothetical protein [Brevibacterium sp. UMB10442]